MGDQKLSSKHYRDMILESIDQLRERKARPDLERISHMMNRRYGISSGRSAALLEKLVDTDVVIKVEYKGQISFRNATKWKKRNLVGHVLNSNHATKKVIEAIEALTKDRPKSLPEEKGASADEISEWLLSRYAETSLVEEKLVTVLQREADLKRLVLLPNGRYKVNPRPPKSEKISRPKSNIKSDPNSTSEVVGSPSASTPAQSPPKRGRPPSKRKKIQKDHGPDFETSIISRNFLPNERCDFCLRGSDFNRKGDFEALLTCRDCSAKAHPSCMDYSEELSRKARNSAWQCIDCKTCCVCEDSGDARSMLFCDACDKGYHMGCHRPQLKIKPTGKWVCGDCSVDEIPSHNTSCRMEGRTDPTLPELGGTSCLPTPCDSPISEKDINFSQEILRNKSIIELDNELMFDDKGEIYPDASRWTINDVVEFFTSKGFQEQAKAFQDQEIDGQSLLLMKRCDVLTGLSLKLGPALKINRHIEKLQMTSIEDL